MARERAKFNIPMVIACVLLCLTLLSVHFTSDIYAKYVSKAEGKDSSKVASFGKLTLVESGDFSNPDKTAIIIPGVNLTKNAVVSFTASEVAVYIIAEAELSDQWETADNRTFVVKNNSNDIVFTVEMTDRAGNTSIQTVKFGIDKTAPVITISYGKAEIHDEEYVDYFRTNRTAKVTITE